MNRFTDDNKINFKNLDYYILGPFIVLVIIGIIMVYSASSNIAIQNGGSPIAYLFKQSFFVLLGIFSMWFIFKKIDKPFLHKYFSSLSFLFFTDVLIALLLMGLLVVGKTVNGSAGWINLGPLKLQPAEFIKFFYIMYYATYAQKNAKSIYEHPFLKNLKYFSYLEAIPLGLVLLQPDLGGTAINLFIILMMVLSIKKNKFRSIGYGTAIILGIWFLLMKVFVPIFSNGFMKNNYQVQRIIAFSNPFIHAQGSGQQLVNSYYAFSNGGLFGVGLGNSIQKTGYLPEPNTDFIMAIISEELGAFTVILIILILMLLIMRIVKIGMDTNTIRDMMICYGTASFILIEAFFNIGGVIGLLPITGVTFPFISYGGSSMVTLCLCLGVVLKISYKQKISSKEG